MKILNKILTYTPSAKFNNRFLNLFGFSFLPYFIFSMFNIGKKNKLENFQNHINKKNFIDVEKLEQDGYLLINNFLDDKDYSQLIHELEEYKIKFKNEKKNDSSYPLMTFYKNIIDSEILNKYFGPESFIYALITSATGISSKLNPPIEYREIENSENKKESYSDNQHLLHFDVNYQSYKAILYLNDIDKENGAFKIIPKSHKVNSQRIKREYIYSISNDIEKIDNLYENEKKNIISLEAKKNSLIIMNAKSIHCRGIFSTEGIRKTIFIDFRFLNTLLNIFFI